MKIAATVFALGMSLAAGAAHAEGPEPISIMDIPDLWMWASTTPILKHAPRQAVPSGFVPDPVSIRPYVRDAVRALGKSCDTVSNILVVPTDSESHVLQIVCTQGSYRLTMARKQEPVLE
jgi:hypothetical protein